MRLSLTGGYRHPLPPDMKLVRLGCELAQGYLFSRPVDGARFRAMLAHGRTLPFDQPSDRPSSKEISR